MPQFMQRAAWSRVSFSLKGTTNSWKCRTRSATGAYLRSCRSISRKPVILPINASAPAFLSSFRDAPLGAGPESITPDRGYGFRVRAEEARPGMTDVFSRPDRDFRLGVGVGLQFLQRAAVFHRHHFPEFRQPFLPVRKNLRGAPRAREFCVPRDQDLQPLDVRLQKVGEHIDTAVRLEIADGVVGILV